MMVSPNCDLKPVASKSGTLNGKCVLVRQHGGGVAVTPPGAVAKRHPGAIISNAECGIGKMPSSWQMSSAALEWIVEPLTGTAQSFNRKHKGKVKRTSSTGSPPDLAHHDLERLTGRWDERSAVSAISMVIQVMSAPNRPLARCSGDRYLRAMAVKFRRPRQRRSTAHPPPDEGLRHACHVGARRGVAENST
ncbi:hypothetical protein [Shinella zoogloeoides]|uniref:hypothetical protein n=1 Tax=Shinella zoogloeoides TaxID=352475 RepID=UPI00299F4C4C|nr:hypothetical protein [Shinella zoogloeoides]WPE24147.1 hypothetical protein ShzoTeo12_53670 [Shinella zoogloeoides]